MKLLSIVLVLVLSNVAFATPGDIGCEAEVNGKKIELLIGYDFHGQTVPSLIEVSEAGSVVFTSPDVQENLVNVGTEEAPFINTTWIAIDEESTATIRIPEQEGSNLTAVVLTVTTDSGLFKVEELEMSCNL